MQRNAMHASRNEKFLNLFQIIIKKNWMLFCKDNNHLYFVPFKELWWHPTKRIFGDLFWDHQIYNFLNAICYIGKLFRPSKYVNVCLQSPLTSTSLYHHRHLQVSFFVMGKTLVQEWVEHAIIVFSMWEVVTNRGYKRAPCQNQRLKKRNLYASLFLGEMMQLRLALTFPSGPKGLGRVTKIDFKRKKNQKTIK